MEREAKEQERKAKQEEKEAKERERQREKELKQQEREAKEAERKKKEEERQKKNNPGQSLLNFFKPKTANLESGSPQKYAVIEQKEIVSEKEEKSSVQSSTDDFLQLIKSQNTPLSLCRQRFFTHKMKDENCYFEQYYTNIFSHRSRLEFTNFLVNEQRVWDYAEPHCEMESGKYDDSSVEYEDLCGDICNEEADYISAEEQEEEENEENSAIVPDTYLSADEMSSGEESKDDILVNIAKGGEWHFSGVHPLADSY